jgi:UPF0716 protein FxsA
MREMSLLKWAIFGLALLPVLEIAVFVWVVLWLGFLAALALSVATTLLGLAVVRHAGRSERDRLRTAFADTTVTQVTLTGPGVLMLLGGILLVLPGFLTDLAGALLLIPGLRGRIHATFSRADPRRAPGPAGVVDLTPEEWERLPEERIRHQPHERGNRKI